MLVNWKATASVPTWNNGVLFSIWLTSAQWWRKVWTAPFFSGTGRNTIWSGLGLPTYSTIGWATNCWGQSLFYFGWDLDAYAVWVFPPQVTSLAHWWWDFCFVRPATYYIWTGLRILLGQWMQYVWIFWQMGFFQQLWIHRCFHTNISYGLHCANAITALVRRFLVRV